MRLDRYQDLIFLARLTAKSGSAPILYEWTEQMIQADGSATDADAPRKGTSTDCAAVELNNTDVDVTSNPLVWMKMRGVPDTGFPRFEFQWGGGASPATQTLTVKEVDGSPSLTGITELQFDQADGYVVSAPAAGKARIDHAPATRTQTGVVSTTTQEFGGDKSFHDALISESTGYLQGDGRVIITNAYPPEWPDLGTSGGVIEFGDPGSFSVGQPHLDAAVYGISGGTIPTATSSTPGYGHAGLRAAAIGGDSSGYADAIISSGGDSGAKFRLKATGNVSTCQIEEYAGGLNWFGRTVVLHLKDADDNPVDLTFKCGWLVDMYAGEGSGSGPGSGSGSGGGPIETDCCPALSATLLATVTAQSGYADLAGASQRIFWNGASWASGVGTFGSTTWFFQMACPGGGASAEDMIGHAVVNGTDAGENTATAGAACSPPDLSFTITLPGGSITVNVTEAP